MISKELTDRISQQLEHAGFPRWDALIIASKERNVSWRNNQTEDFKETAEIGYGVRLWKDDRMALAYANDPSADVIAQTIEKAAFMLKYAMPDPCYTIADTIKVGQKLPKPDPAISDRPISEKISMLATLESAVRESDKRITKVEHLGFSESLDLMSYRTDKSDWFEQHSGHAGMGGEVIAEATGEMEAGSAYDYKTRWNDIDPVRLVQRISESATGQLGGTPIKSGVIPVVFDADVMAHFLGTFIDLFSADKTQNQRSVLAGKRGEKIGSPLIYLIDDATVLHQLGSYAWDAEGSAGRVTPLIDGGVLTDYLYDRRTAAKEGRESTGHGHRSSYRGSPLISPSNLILSAGPLSVNDLLGKFPRCLWVKHVMGMHTCNAVNGDFSVGATGHLVENGVVVRPVKQVTLAGNWLTVLSDVVGIGNDVDNFPIHGNILTPSVAIEKLNLSGL